MDSDNNPAWAIMAELGEHLPEVPVAIMSSVAKICIEEDSEKRIMLGFDFVNALNEMKLVTIMAGAIADGSAPFTSTSEFRPPYDDDQPRFSDYGFRLDTRPENGETEIGTPVYATNTWTGVYEFDDDPDNKHGIRCLLNFEDVPQDSFHPDVVEVWLRPAQARHLASDIINLIDSHT